MLYRVVEMKFGLIKRGENERKRTNVSVFVNSFDDDNDVTNQSLSDKKRINYSINKDINNKILEIPATENSIYDYDASYDSFKATNLNTTAKELNNVNVIPQSRYINSLLLTAKVRDKEKERIFEKKLLKERTVEDVNFTDKPKFMTSAYKKKLLEDKKWESEARFAEEIEKKTDVRNRGMEGFYANLLTKNISLGSNVTDNSLSVFSAGGTLQKNMLNEYNPVIKDEAPTITLKKTHGNQFKIENVDSKEDINRGSGYNLNYDNEMTAAVVENSRSDKKEEIDSARIRFLQRKKLKN